jgi:hypothetical protein
MKNTISKKYIVEYITTNYGQLKHDADKFTKAIRETANHYKLNKVDLFHYIIERTNSIPLATSYGFDTRYGRAIREDFETCYYSY